MKARRIVWPSAKEVAIEEFDLPLVGQDDVLIETEYTVVSPGTELAFLQGKANTAGIFPQYPGYSGVGKIIKVGERVEDFSVGERVLMDHCGHASHVVCNVAGWRSQGITKVESPVISPREAAFLIIASMSLQGVRKARIQLGESAMVMGLGLLGLFAVQLCRLSGAALVVALDFQEERRALAREFGADCALSPAENDFPQQLKQLTAGRGVNAIIEVTGSANALSQALACSAGQGRVVLLGCTREIQSGMNFYECVHKTGVSIIGAHNYVRPRADSSPGMWTTRDDLQALLALLAAGRLRIEPMITEEAAPRNAPEVYRRFLNREEQMLGVLFNWKQ